MGNRGWVVQEKLGRVFWDKGYIWRVILLLSRHLRFSSLMFSSIEIVCEKIVFPKEHVEGKRTLERPPEMRSEEGEQQTGFSQERKESKRCGGCFQVETDPKAFLLLVAEVAASPVDASFPLLLPSLVKPVPSFHLL